MVMRCFWDNIMKTCPCNNIQRFFKVLKINNGCVFLMADLQLKNTSFQYNKLKNKHA